MRIERTLPVELEAVGAARRALDPLKRELAPDLLDDLRLMVSELVTNSLRHAHANGRVRVIVDVTPTVVRLEVCDEGAGFDPANLATPTTESTDGWGLFLVERISDRWGVHREPGAAVWAEVDR